MTPEEIAELYRRLDDLTRALNASKRYLRSLDLAGVVIAGLLAVLVLQHCSQ